MAIITISRQFGSGGDEIAARVGEILGYSLFDKRMVAKAATTAGLSEQEIFDYSEDNHKVRSFFERLFGSAEILASAPAWNTDFSAFPGPTGFKLSEGAALSLEQKAIHTAYQLGDMIIIGRGGQIILRDFPGVLHVRVEAPLDFRIQHVMAQLKQEGRVGLDLYREAQELTGERDAASADYIKRFYRAEWDDPLLYHLVINTARLSLEQAAQLIANLAQEINAPEKTAQVN